MRLSFLHMDRYRGRHLSNTGVRSSILPHSFYHLQNVTFLSLQILEETLQKKSIWITPFIKYQYENIQYFLYSKTTLREC